MAYQPKDFPLDECAARAERILAKLPDAKVFQKWTCRQCKRRLCSDIPNQFSTSGRCEYCGHVTNIKKWGCNYLVMAKNTSLDTVMSID